MEKLIVMFFSAFTCVFALPFLIGHFAPMKWWQVAAMIAAGFGGAGGQYLCVRKHIFMLRQKKFLFLTIRRSCFQLLWDFWSWDRSRICLVFADM